MKHIYAILLLIVSNISIAQNSIDNTRMADSSEFVVASLVNVDKRFANEIDISVGRSSLGDMLRNVAKMSGINLAIRTGEEINVTCNFSRTKVSDLLIFLCREHNLKIEATGNIATIYHRPPTRPKAREMHISRDSIGNFSIDVRNDNLLEVSKRIGTLGRLNIIIPSTLHSTQVSGYLMGMTIDDAINTLAAVNGLMAQKTKENVWTITQTISNDPQNTVRLNSFRPQVQFADNELSIDSLGLITARISRGDVSDIIGDICRRQKLNHFFITPISQSISVFVSGVNFETLLDVILTGAPYSYYTNQGVYFFGSLSPEREMNNVKVIPLKYRSVNKVIEIIPAALQKNTTITQFADQNSLIVSGASGSVGRIESFIYSIDKPVPLIAMEIIIVDSKKSNAIEAGIDMGIGSEPVSTGGQLSPGIDFTFGASSVNRLIESFNGFGSINIGKVSPNFYLSLKLLEQNGTIELRSTPKLSALNGHEASLKSGETKYYKEVVNNIIGSQNPIQSESYTWKSIEANLDIKITPYVSSNNHITLEIEIEQSEFTPREEKNAPPGRVTRSFKSKIKVENEDMVLLGGIERNAKEKSSSGLPFISRIPVLKWIFGQTTDSKVDHKLNVLIKPTIIM